MAKRVVTTSGAAPPGGPYSQAVIAGEYVYCSGAIPARPDGTRVEGPFVDQARAAFGTSPPSPRRPAPPWPTRSGSGCTCATWTTSWR